MGGGGKRDRQHGGAGRLGHGALRFQCHYDSRRIADRLQHDMHCRAVGKTVEVRSQVDAADTQDGLWWRSAYPRLPIAARITLSNGVG